MKIVTFTMMKSLFLLLLISQMALAQSDKSEAVQQLRIYEIFEHNKAAFHERFDNHAQRIMKKYGFNIIAMWETKTGTKTEFVYLLQWSDVKTLQDSWKKFMADEEWKEIKRQTAQKYGQLVGEIQDRILTPVYYSPKKVL